MAQQAQQFALRTLAHFDTLEVRLCRHLNRQVRHRRVHRFFALVSRLGDGVFWYGLMILLALAPATGSLPAALQMGLTSLAGVLVYKALKTTLVRERPYVGSRIIHCALGPLDRYSFPSGHTLQAVLFTTVALAWFPLLALLLVPMTGLIALSRVILGLHYPSDVLCGALIGWGLASLSLWLYPVGI